MFLVTEMGSRRKFSKYSSPSGSNFQLEFSLRFVVVRWDGICFLWRLHAVPGKYGPRTPKLP